MRLNAKDRRKANKRLFKLDTFQASEFAAWDAVTAILNEHSLFVPGMVWVPKSGSLRVELTAKQDDETTMIGNSFLIFQTHAFPTGRVELNVFLS